MYEVDCAICEVSFEIKVTDYFLITGTPEIRFCPSCGKETLINT